MSQLSSVGLYIHFPWCVRKCPYCDFNSHASSGEVPEARYIDALLADLDQDLRIFGQRRVETVFMGGGTPSLFSADALSRLLSGIRQRLDLARDAEITLEANPGTAEADKFAGFRAAGINRISLGVQSFDDVQLTRLGRIHGSAEAKAAARMAVAAGFDNFNLDLMFGLPDQTPQEALADVRQAIALEPTHISFYQLTLEPNTLFHRYPPALPEDETVWAIQQLCQTELAKADYGQYEVSAYARQGFRCRHNLNYWRFGDYLGIGAGAHGKLTGEDGKVIRYWKHKHPQHYLQSAGKADSLGGQSEIAPEELPVEFLMNHLRLREGFAEASYSIKTGLDWASLEPGLGRAMAAGLLERLDGFVRCTDTGWNFLDNALAHFLPDPP